MRKALLRVWLLASFSLIVGHGLAFAQAQKGNTELLLGGSVSSSNASFNGQSSSNVSGNFNFGVGFFVTNGLELGIKPSINITTSPGGQQLVGFRANGTPIIETTPRTTSTSGVFNFYVRQHFGRGKVAPYVGGQISSMSSSGSDETTNFGGGEFGLKNYLSEKTALDLNLFVGGQLNTPESGTSQTQVVFSVGITHLF